MAKKKTTAKKTKRKAPKAKKLSAAKLKKLKGGIMVPSGFSRAIANPRFGDRTPNGVTPASWSGFSGGGGGGSNSGANRGRSGR